MPTFSEIAKNLRQTGLYKIEGDNDGNRWTFYAAANNEFLAREAVSQPKEFNSTIHSVEFIGPVSYYSR